MYIVIDISGDIQTSKALQELGRRSPRAMLRAISRTVGVARKRAIRETSRATGISQRVLAGGRRGSGGYIKQVRDHRGRPTGSLIGLVEGVKFSRLRRKRLGRSQRKSGGLGKPFQATMRSGHSSLFERVAPLKRTSIGATPRTRRPNLPIREVVVPIQPHAERAMRRHMREAARTVLPAKTWEELRKLNRPKR